ncbi:MAG: hypothetical protein WAT88_02475 [Saprospiraceae bacterium]
MSSRSRASILIRRNSKVNATKKIKYGSLNNRQKESYNFQKVSSILAEYGFVTIKLNDDWQGADFIAQHIDGNTFLKIQLKGRLTVSKKYMNKNIYICFPYHGDWYLIDHDEVLATISQQYNDTFSKSNSWIKQGEYSWGRISQKMEEMLAHYKL